PNKAEGGSICLLCFSHRPRVLRPLSVLSGHLLRSLLAFHPHFLRRRTHRTTCRPSHVRSLRFRLCLAL
ncbi:unnamed protein product, partial [Prunus brigantina]